MSYTGLLFMGFHKIAYAHALTAQDYQFTLSSYGFGSYGASTQYGGVLEIGFVERNPAILHNMQTGEELALGEMDVFVVPPNHLFSVRTQNPGEHKHTSCEFLIDCTTGRIEKEELEREDFLRMRDNFILLPYVFPASKDNEPIISLIRKIARDRMLGIEKSYFSECSDLMRLLCELGAVVRRRNSFDSVSPAHRRYCEKAKEYISCHYNERIALDEVAAFVGLNKNYLTNLFSNCEGMPISEYINRLKLSRMMDMVLKYDYSIKRGGEYVGFSDVNYVSRIFKRYYGITISEYKKMHHSYTGPATGKK